MKFSDSCSLKQARGKKLANEYWNALKSVSDEDTRTAMFDALPGKYKTHINGKFDKYFQSMDEIEFLEAMLRNEIIDKACRDKRNSNKEKDKKSKDTDSKKVILQNMNL